MTTTRKQYRPSFKARVALEAIRSEKTLSQLGPQYKVHLRSRSGAVAETGNDDLYEEIGRLKVELDWLKAKVGMLD